MEETILYTKYALLTTEAYVELNKALSKALGYREGLSTEVYNTENPPVSNGLCVMVLTAEVQERFPELLEGMELVDSVVIDVEELDGSIE